MPTFADIAVTGSSGNASPVTKSDMVKPIPAMSAIPTMCFHCAPAGSGAIFRRTATKTAAEHADALARDERGGHAEGDGTEERSHHRPARSLRWPGRRAARCRRRRDRGARAGAARPAAASRARASRWRRANLRRVPRGSWRRLSSATSRSSRASSRLRLLDGGDREAHDDPRERRMQPGARNGHPERTRPRGCTATGDRRARARGRRGAPRWRAPRRGSAGALRFPYATAMIRIAPRSSKMASAVRKTKRLHGTRRFTIDRHPSANAMSVAVGMAQPLGLGAARVEGEVDERRRDHAAGGGDQRKRCAPNASGALR